MPSTLTLTNAETIRRVHALAKWYGDGRPGRTVGRLIDEHFARVSEQLNAQPGGAEQPHPQDTTEAA
jgi:hypothetical protein